MKTYLTKTTQLALFLFILLASVQSCVLTSIHPLYSNDVLTHLTELNGVWKDADNEVRITTVIDTVGVNGVDLSEKYIELLSEKEQGKQVDNQLSKIEGDMFFKAMKNPLQRSYYRVEYISEKTFGGNLKGDTIAVKGVDVTGDSTVTHNEPRDTTVFVGKLLKLEGKYYLDLILEDEYLEKEISNINILETVFPLHLFCKLQLKDDLLQLNFIKNDSFRKFYTKKRRARVGLILSEDRAILSSSTKDLQKMVVKYANEPFFNNEDTELRLKREK